MTLLDLSEFLDRAVVIHVVEMIERGRIQRVGGPEGEFVAKFGAGLLPQRRPAQTGK